MVHGIEVRDLHQHYGENQAVDDLSLGVTPGKVFGLVDPGRGGQDDDDGDLGCSSFRRDQRLLAGTRRCPASIRVRKEAR